MGRQQLIREYPPNNWICPGCGRQHSKSHYAVEGQIDYTKKPGEEGRVLFNRRNKDDRLATDTPIDESKPMKGEPLDSEGNPQPIYCAHCGFEADVIVLVRVGELPDMVDRFLEEEGIEARRTPRELLSDFLDWLKRRQAGF